MAELKTIIPSIKKRNGEVASFNASKISEAIFKAASAVGGNDREQADSLTGQIVKALEVKGDSYIPTVEEIQDLVEKVLIENGHAKTAKAYILYRSRHEEERLMKKQESLEKLQKHSLMVVKKSGEKQQFNEDKLMKTISHALIGYEEVAEPLEILNQCMENLHDDISTKNINSSVIMTLRPLIEQNKAYSKIASKFLLNNFYKEIIGENIDFEKLGSQYREAFKDGIKRGVDMDRLSPKLLTFDLDGLAESLLPERDMLFEYMGIQTLYDRYFLRDTETQRLLETPQAFWMRVSMGLAINERDKMEAAKKFYNILSNLRYIPSTPTLLHSGTVHPQLSSCYLTTVGDELDHIFKCIGDNAQMSKWSGGLGNDWTNLRATHAMIKRINTHSNGIIPFLKIADDTTAAINRSGKRRGATCAYLETFHLDLEDFLDLRKNTGDERRRTPDMNTSNWIPDLFMQRVKDDEQWTLFSPEEVSDLHHVYGKKFKERYEEYERMADDGKIKLFKRLKAKDLWRKMVTMLFETGHPWMTFKDPCNIRSPQDHAGVVHSSNLCTEITLNTSFDETAVCNLGSVNLSRHISNGKLDEPKIKETVTIAMQMLDNVIDINFYPTKEAKNSNLRHRPVGLGVMGTQDALYMLNLRFDSEEAVRFADESMEMIAYYAILSSSKLAEEKGTYESYHGSKWSRGILPQDTIALLEDERGVKINVDKSGKMDWTPVREHVKKYGMRNSNCMAIAPTATIANIAGAYPSVEPIYKNLYVKANQGGEFTVVNNYLVEELRSQGLWDFEMFGKIKYHDGSVQEIHEIPEEIRAKYKGAFEINPLWTIKAAAYRGKWIDQSQSLNIFYGGTSGKEISNIYRFAWEMGLKTTYYLRTLGISQVEKSTVDVNTYGETHKRKAQNAKAPKVCVVEDPTCESCQ